MPAGSALNEDDYVISLLTKDAEANKKRYLSSGLGSLLSSKRRSENAPRPNTRFLKNVIRDVDAHNTALRVKEEEDAAKRLRDLKREETGGKRKREDGGDARGEGKRRREGEKEGRWARALGGLGEPSGTGGSKHRKVADQETKDAEPRTSKHSRRREKDEDGNRSSRSEPPKDHQRREHSNRDKGRQYKHHRSSRSRSPPKERSRHARDKVSNDDDDNLSDPLDDVIGPKPPPKIRPRGRGASNNTPSMDNKFDPKYNPRTDVDISPDDGERDDWDMALEALRDRAKWRVQGGDRLRRAGFSEAEVKKWEGEGGLLGYEEDKGEKGVDDVRWSKKGEAREWDQGKTVGKGGNVELRASWAKPED